MSRMRYGCALLEAVAAMALSTGTVRAQYATSVESYDAGSAAGGVYVQPAVALGTPERFTGEGTGFDGVVSPFSAAWLPNEIVKIGTGGHLTLSFDSRIEDDPAHPFGVDFIVFGNGALEDADWPNATTGSPAGIFGTDDMFIEVSQDGINFVPLGTFAEGLFPTSGFLDGGAYDASPGSAPSDFRKPVDPSLTLGDFDALDYAGVLGLYDGSGGGTPIDLAPAGLAWATHIRITVPDGADHDVEIDAISVVPEPVPGSLMLVVMGIAFRRHSRG